MIADAVFCVVCEQDTLPLEENGLCGWCMCNPTTGKPDRVAYQRERSRINCRRSRERKRARLEAKVSSQVNDRAAGLDPRKVRRPAAQIGAS